LARQLLVYFEMLLARRRSSPLPLPYRCQHLVVAIAVSQVLCGGGSKEAAKSWYNVLRLDVDEVEARRRWHGWPQAVYRIILLVLSRSVKGCESCSCCSRRRGAIEGCAPTSRPHTRTSASGCPHALARCVTRRVRSASFSSGLSLCLGGALCEYPPSCVLYVRAPMCNHMLLYLLLDLASRWS
jgi:hypothetical protein